MDFRPVRGQRRVQHGRRDGIFAGDADGGRVLFPGRRVGLDAECLLPSRQRGFNARFLPGADGSPAVQPAP